MIFLEKNNKTFLILHKMLSKLQGIEEEQKETMEFLDTAIEGKKIFKEENEKLRERVKSLEENVKGLQSIIGNNSSNNTAVAAIFDRSIYI
jgi:cell division septum initiation protein DivIVA